MTMTTTTTTTTTTIMKNHYYHYNYYYKSTFWSTSLFFGVHVRSSSHKQLLGINTQHAQAQAGMPINQPTSMH